MRKLLLLILSLSLLVQHLTAGEKKKSVMTSGPAPTQYSLMFSEAQIRMMVAQIQAEAERKINLAYDDGYKAGVLEYAPRAESAEQENSELKKELKSTKWHTCIYVTCSFAIGFISGIMMLRG